MRPLGLAFAVALTAGGCSLLFNGNDLKGANGGGDLGAGGTGGGDADMGFGGAGGGGTGGGKVSVSSFNIMKRSDVATPILFQACCKGDHFPSAIVTLNKAAGSAALDFIKYEFDEVYVDSVQWSGSSGGDDTPMESVSFSFGKVSITYTPQNKDGSKGSPAVGAWDLTAVTA